MCLKCDDTGFSYGQIPCECSLEDPIVTQDDTDSIDPVVYSG